MKSRRGAALIELAMSLPLLLLLLMGMVDLGRWLNTYYQISRMSYESARYAASLAGLEATSLNNNSVLDTTSIQNQVVVRFRDMLTSYGYDTTNVTITHLINMEFNASGTTTATGIPPNSVWVRVSLPFNALFANVVGVQRVASTATAPYLFSRQGCTPIFNTSTNELSCT